MLDTLLQEMVRGDPAQRPAAEEVKERFERIGGTQLAQTAFVMRSGAEVYSVGELVQVCEKNPEVGRFHLVQGHFRDWLLAQNRHDLAAWAEQSVAQAPDDKVALEWFLRGLDPDLPLPELALEGEVIDFGEVERDSSYSLLVPFTNSARGYLVVAMASQAPWLVVNSSYVGCYAGELGQMQVTLNTRDMEEGRQQRPALALAWEEQQARVPVRMAVLWPPGGRVEPASFDLGLVVEGEPAPVITATLNNRGGSDWVGRVYTDSPWLALQGGAFRIPRQGAAQMMLAAQPQLLQPGQWHRAAVTVVSNAGSQVAPVRVRVARRWYLGRSRLRRWLAFAAPMGLSVAGFGFGIAHLAHILANAGKPPLGELYSVLIGLAAWVLGLLLAATFVPVLDEIEDFHHGGDLALDLPVCRFRRGSALVVTGLGGLAGLLIGLGYGRVVEPASALQALYALAGLLAGSLAGLAAMTGAADAWTGMKPLPGLSWLATRPVAKGLVRAGFLALMLGLLATMLAWTRAGPIGSATGPAALAALIGLVLAADGYPYLSKRVQATLAWLRPSVRAGVIAYASAQIVILILGAGSGNEALAGVAANGTPAAEFRLPLLVALLAALAQLGGGILGLVVHDEVGFGWRQELRRIVPVAAILLVTAPAVYWLSDRITAALFGNGVAWLSLLITFLVVVLLALTLSGRSAWLRQWLQRGQSTAGRWLQQVQLPDQAHGWVQTRSDPLRWLQVTTQTGANHPVTLATVVLLSVLMAPLFVRLFGALLWLLFLGGMAAAGVWWWRRNQSNKPAPWTGGAS